MPREARISIAADVDLVRARAEARALALELGFSRTDATLIATAISEIARNILVHAAQGEMTLQGLRDEQRQGLRVVARDDGPGIRDVEAALLDGRSGRGGLGLGLPGARRLMDEFDVACGPDQGTTVTMTKWRLRTSLERLHARRVGDG
jgi:serine/threonine-protein kinase RsbT